MEQMLETTMARLLAEVAGTTKTERAGVVTLMRALPATEENLAMLEARWRFDEASMEPLESR